MLRPCSICNGPQEYLPMIHERWRSGESIAAIAREYSLSEDALTRHLKNHVGANDKTGNGSSMDAASVFHEIAIRAGELARSATLTGDLRGAIDALARQASAAESYTRLDQEKKNAQAQDAKQNGLTLADLDAMVAAVQANYDPCPHCHQLRMPKLPKLASAKPDMELLH